VHAFEALVGEAVVGRIRLWIVACVAVALVLPSVTPAHPAQPAVSPAGDTFGVDLVPPQTPSALPLAGVSWVRIAADWSVLEPSLGHFAWGPLDTEVRQAADAKLRIVLLLEHTPQWAALTPNSPAGVWSHQPPKRDVDWIAFVRAIASRYRGRVAAWQVEPSLDLVDFRGTTPDYLAMLRTVRVEAKRADPRAAVIAASPGGFDLPYVKAMLAREGAEFDVLMLYPRGRTAAQALEALTTIRARIRTDAHHQLWLSAAPDGGTPVQLAAVALAGGVARGFWPALDPAVATAVRYLAGARFVGPLDRGPGVAAFVFEKGGAPVIVGWTVGGTQPVAIATTGAPVLVGPTGLPAAAPAAAAAPVLLGTDPVIVVNPDPSMVQEAGRTATRGPWTIPADAAHDFSKVDTVSAELGAANVEHGLYNQRLRSLPSGGVVPLTADGVSAVRTDVNSDAVYVYFGMDDSFAYFDDGRDRYVISVQVHKAGAPQRVGFNLLYDSMSGYRFTPWQWVDAGDGWATYTFEIADAAFAKTWGWDFAVNGAGDHAEPLVVRAVTVQRVPIPRTP